jgi:hypothetical protein
MKYLWIFLILISITGCQMLGAVRSSIMGDPNISAEDKIEYATELERMQIRAAEARFFNYIAAGVIVISILVGIYLKSPGTSIFGVLSGFILSAWGLFAAENPKIVAAIIIASFIAMFMYVFGNTITRKKNGQTLVASFRGTKGNTSVDS